ncbi:TNT domain-containing protein [Bailinhaonella thermotolerans]|uniref:DUF4237 domain-containing protein n=1 Tax=Bailinhaonella thermotolerans TaxID=1070861 RepID=A0A3A4AZ79_9ACTN|nr:DUF4237 domain-containing protein [Bailinhaonella thermotolerans]
MEPSPWRPNNGLLHEPVKKTLNPGTRIDRYGSRQGSFVSSEETHFLQRGIPFHAERDTYHIYEVQKAFTVQARIAAPTKGFPGGGFSANFPIRSTGSCWMDILRSYISGQRPTVSVILGGQTFCALNGFPRVGLSTIPKEDAMKRRNCSPRKIKHAATS